MKYKFSKYKISNSILYDIDVEDDDFYPITLLRFSYWTPLVIQQLIDGILSTKDTDKEYKYQTEGDDLYIYSNDYGVQFFDLNTQKKDADLILPHGTFIDFLKDFKDFVEANS